MRLGCVAVVRFGSSLRGWAMVGLALAALVGCASSSKKPGRTPVPPPEPPVKPPASKQEAAKSYADLGAAYMERGSYDLALARLQMALERDPELPDTYHYLGELYGRLDQWETADGYYRKALKLAPDDSVFHNNYGVFLCRWGKYARADREFERVLKDPFYRERDRLYVNMGLCKEQAGQVTSAVDYFKRAVDANPFNPQPLLNLARVSLSQGRYKDAVSYVERFRAVNGHYTSEALGIGLDAARRVGNRDAVGSYSLLLERKFPASAEAKRLLRAEEY
jgi:type IV pilus assembly protein PilF